MKSVIPVVLLVFKFPEALLVLIYTYRSVIPVVLLMFKFIEASLTERVGSLSLMKFLKSPQKFNCGSEMRKLII